MMFRRHKAPLRLAHVQPLVLTEIITVGIMQSDKHNSLGTEIGHEKYVTENLPCPITQSYSQPGSSDTWMCFNLQMEKPFWTTLPAVMFLFKESFNFSNWRYIADWFIYFYGKIFHSPTLSGMRSVFIAAPLTCLPVPEVYNHRKVAVKLGMWVIRGIFVPWTNLGGRCFFPVFLL